MQPSPVYDSVRCLHVIFAENYYKEGNLNRIRHYRGILNFLKNVLRDNADEEMLEEMLLSGIACSQAQIKSFDTNLWGGSVYGVRLVWDGARTFGMTCIHPRNREFIEGSASAISSLKQLFQSSRCLENTGAPDSNWIREVSLFARSILSWMPFAMLHLLSSVDQEDTTIHLRELALQLKELLGLSRLFTCQNTYYFCLVLIDTSLRSSADKWKSIRNGDCSSFIPSSLDFVALLNCENIQESLREQMIGGHISSCECMSTFFATKISMLSDVVKNC